ncbi:MAG: hypothetical protein HY673_05715 [Chloroflexi bacterium]|nr:hypothetical protein [Chloroflexota bacterium]
MDRTLASVDYASGMFEETAPGRSLIDEVLQVVQAEAERSAVAIRRAYVHRFASREIPGYEELVITLFGDADRGKLVDFASVLSERIGSWRQTQGGAANESFANQLVVEIVPLEFLDHVRS